MKKLFLSLCLVLTVATFSVFGFTACKKDSEHPSKFVGTYMYDNIYLSGLRSYIDTEVIEEIFTSDCYLKLNKDGSVETNLYQKTAEYFSKELGYTPTYYYDYQWHANYDNIYFTGFGEFYDQVGNVLKEYFNYVLFASLVQFYSLSNSTLTGNGSSGIGSGAYTYTITFKKAN